MGRRTYIVQLSIETCETYTDPSDNSEQLEHIDDLLVDTVHFDNYSDAEKFIADTVQG